MDWLNANGLYKGHTIEILTEEVHSKANGEWKAEIQIAPHARGIDSIVPVFGYSSERECRSAAFELAKGTYRQNNNPESRLSEIGTK